MADFSVSLDKISQNSALFYNFLSAGPSLIHKGDACIMYNLKFWSMTWINLDEASWGYWLLSSEPSGVTEVAYYSPVKINPSSKIEDAAEAAYGALSIGTCEEG